MKYWRCTTYVVVGFNRNVYTDFLASEDHDTMVKWKESFTNKYTNQNTSAVVTSCAEIDREEFENRRMYMHEDWIYLIDNKFFSVYDILVMAKMAYNRNPVTDGEIDTFFEETLIKEGRRVEKFVLGEFSAKCKEYLASRLLMTGALYTGNDDDDDGGLIGSITDPYYGGIVPCGLDSETGDAPYISDKSTLMNDYVSEKTTPINKFERFK